MDDSPENKPASSPSPYREPVPRRIDDLVPPPVSVYMGPPPHQRSRGSRIMKIILIAVVAAALIATIAVLAARP